MFELRGSAVVTRCVHCGEVKARVKFRQGSWAVVGCSSCGLLRTWPEPSDELLADSYTSADYHHTRTNDDPVAWDERAQQILARLPARPGSVLDFGAGEGHLVAALRRQGVCAEGVEPFGAGREAALEAHGVALAEALDPNGGAAFDAAVLLHSLEHVRDPLVTLNEIRCVLVSGATVFVEVPNVRSADMWLSPRQRRLILDLPLHLHHFTPHTLERVAVEAGFSPVQTIDFNATAVERLLRLRSAGAAVPVQTPPEGEPSATEPAPSLGPSRGEKILSSLRRRLPGPKFQWIGVAAPMRR